MRFMVGVRDARRDGAGKLPGACQGANCFRPSLRRREAGGGNFFWPQRNYYLTPERGAASYFPSGGGQRGAQFNWSFPVMSLSSTGAKKSGGGLAGFRLEKFRRGGRRGKKERMTPGAGAELPAAGPGEGGLAAVPALGVLLFPSEVKALAEQARCGVYSAAVAVLVRLLRQARGWSEVELASRSGVKRQSIHAWECARQLPRLDRMWLVTLAFGLSAGDLPNGAEEIARRVVQF